MLHFAYFLEEFRGIPPREPPISGTRVTTNWAGERPTSSLSSADMHTVSCRFSLCAVELPASCAGAAVRAPASHDDPKKYTASCEAGARTGGMKLEGSKRGTDRNGSAYPALLVEYDGVLTFFPRVCC